MKLKLLIATLLTANVSVAFADTYVVPAEKTTANDAPRLSER